MIADFGTAVANASRLGSNAGVVLKALENRAALAALELEEAGRHLTTTLVWAFATSTALLLSGVTLTAVVAAVFWDTPQRVPALVILGVLELAVAAAGGWYVATQWQQWRLFKDSREQLTKDSACLREILTTRQD